jgi:hypothetical protein
MQADEDCEHMLLGKPFPDTFLPCLESLQVYTLDAGDFGMFLMPFILSHLKYLEVKQSRYALWPEVLSAQCLRHLEAVKFKRLEPRAVQAFLKDAALVEEWSFQGIESTDSLDDLIAAICCGDLVPALRVFECDYKVANAMLIPMLKSRGKFADRSAASRYATIESVFIRGEPTGHGCQFLDDCRDRGVEVVFKARFDKSPWIQSLMDSM